MNEVNETSKFGYDELLDRLDSQIDQVIKDGDNHTRNKLLVARKQLINLAQQEITINQEHKHVKDIIDLLPEMMRISSNFESWEMDTQRKLNIDQENIEVASYSKQIIDGRRNTSTTKIVNEQNIIICDNHKETVKDLSKLFHGECVDSSKTEAIIIEESRDKTFAAFAKKYADKLEKFHSIMEQVQIIVVEQHENMKEGLNQAGNISETTKSVASEGTGFSDNLLSSVILSEGPIAAFGIFASAVRTVQLISEAVEAKSILKIAQANIYSQTLGRVVRMPKKDFIQDGSENCHLEPKFSSEFYDIGVKHQLFISNKWANVSRTRKENENIISSLEAAQMMFRKKLQDDYKLLRGEKKLDHVVEIKISSDGEEKKECPLGIMCSQVEIDILREQKEYIKNKEIDDLYFFKKLEMLDDDVSTFKDIKILVYKKQRGLVERIRNIKENFFPNVFEKIALKYSSKDLPSIVSDFSLTYLLSAPIGFYNILAKNFLMILKHGSIANELKWAMLQEKMDQIIAINANCRPELTVESEDILKSDLLNVARMGLSSELLQEDLNFHEKRVLILRKAAIALAAQTAIDTASLITISSGVATPIVIPLQVTSKVAGYISSYYKEEVEKKATWLTKMKGKRGDEIIQGHIMEELDEKILQTELLKARFKCNQITPKEKVKTNHETSWSLFLNKFKRCSAKLYEQEVDTYFAVSRISSRRVKRDIMMSLDKKMYTPFQQLSRDKFKMIQTLIKLQDTDDKAQQCDNIFDDKIAKNNIATQTLISNEPTKIFPKKYRCRRRPQNKASGYLEKPLLQPIPIINNNHKQLTQVDIIEPQSSKPILSSVCKNPRRRRRQLPLKYRETPLLY